MKHLFREYLPLKDAFLNDPYAIWLHIIGGIFIAITFFVIGLLCVVMADSGTEKKTKKNIILTQLFGFFLISCAIARAIDVLCLWHDYAIINGYVKVLTGLIAIAAVFMIPGVIKEGIENSKLHNIGQKLDVTNQKLEEIKELNEKLTK